MDTENAWFRRPKASKSYEISYLFHADVFVLIGMEEAVKLQIS